MVRSGRSTTAAGLVAGLAALTVLASAPSVVAAEPDAPHRAPVLGASSPDAIPGDYIVVMKPRTDSRASGLALRQVAGVGGRVTHQYHSALNGFAAHLPPHAVEALRNNPNVAYLEADQRVTVSTTQTSPTWGLDRIDQHPRAGTGAYDYDRTGAGVNVYVIDTGIRAGHHEFGGRVAPGFTAVQDGRGTDDCYGHGTHVAGTIGGTTYGVAKKVTLRPVRVLNCSGSGSDAKVIAGIDWVTSHHTGTSPAVANMSLGGSASTALDDAVSRSIADGVTYVVAAGNEDQDACSSSPARTVAALTVGATTRSDARAGFSNFGSCVDLFAPGTAITSAWNTGNRATNTISGTSMASPHVAGAAALYLEAFPAAPPASVAAALLSSATTGVVSGRGPGSPNRLLFSRVDTAPVLPPTVLNSLANPGFESGATGWSASSGVITNIEGAPARGGDWKAWMTGYGKVHTDIVSQSVTVPVGPAPTLSFYLLVGSEEGTTRARDTLKVEVVSGTTTTTVGTYSNRDQARAFVAHHVDLSAYAGTTVTVRFTATENASAATSFVLDDTTLSAG